MRSQRRRSASPRQRKARREALYFGIFLPTICALLWLLFLVAAAGVR